MLIIDAFNLLHAAAAVSPRIGGLSVLQLAEIVASCPPPSGVSGAGSRGEVEAVMVVDGTGGGLEGRLRGQAGGGGWDVRGGVRVRLKFAGAGREADEVIERMLEEHARRGKGTARGCLVVSSDKRVQAAARGARAKFVPSEVFLALLAGSAEWKVAQGGGGARGPAAEGRPAFASDVPLDRESARWWMKFLEVDEGTVGTIESSVASTGERDERSADWGRKERGKEREAADRETGTKRREKPAREEGSSRQSVDLGMVSDPVLRAAMREWGERIRPDDLEMSKWLKDGDQAGG